MKLVVTATDARPDAPVDPRFGRAHAFVLVDTETGERSVHTNTQNLKAAQGAGIQAAGNVVDLGAEAVLTGNVGPKAFAVLQAADVTVFLGASGTVDQALQAHADGTLRQAEGANVQGHWV